MNRRKFFIEENNCRLFENAGINIVDESNLISVDIQPAYENAFSFNIYAFVEFLNNNFDTLNTLTFLFNGPDLGYPNENEYKDWLIEIGLNENIINSSYFYDKGYAFFRYCMDEGIDDEELVDLIKYMISYNINDSRDIDEKMWNNFMLEYNYDQSDIRDLLEVADDMINIPDLMDFLKNYSGKIILCGGGIKECLKEVEIALMALDKNYNILTKYTY
jgi:hypothetical protein